MTLGGHKMKVSCQTSHRIHLSQLDLPPGLDHVKRQREDSSDLQGEVSGCDHDGEVTET